MFLCCALTEVGIHAKGYWNCSLSHSYLVHPPHKIPPDPMWRIQDGSSGAEIPGRSPGGGLLIRPPVRLKSKTKISDQGNQMVRSEDPPGDVKHLRFGRPDHLEEIKQFPGVKAIVLHKKGKTGEHPHLHVWWEGEKAATNQTIRNHFKKQFPAIFGTDLYSGQQNWSFRNHDSWEVWAKYVCGNTSHEVLLSYRDLDAVSVNAKNLIVATPITASKPVILKKRPTAEERLIAYAVTERKWEKGNHFKNATHHNWNQVADEARECVLEYANGRVHNTQLIAMVRNLMWVFSDAENREVLSKTLGAQINFFN